jgi:transposase
MRLGDLLFQLDEAAPAASAGRWRCACAATGAAPAGELAAIAAATREIEGLAAIDDRTRRLMTIPGFGPLAATALLAAAGDGR